MKWSATSKDTERNRWKYDLLGKKIIKDLSTSKIPQRTNPDI